MVICAAITLVVILFTTIYYTERQRNTYRDNVHAKDFSELSLSYFVSVGDSLQISDLEGSPFVIHFWSTWSGMSIEMNHLFSRISDETGIEVVAAVVRDDPDLVRSYLREFPNDFHIVGGTDLFYELESTGVPSQIFFDQQGRVYDIQIGKDEERVEEIIHRLMQIDS